ncbi:MAG: ABC transporter permease [Bacteroidales bacterium]|nr:ABC transporter permease [Bacteroidales bacterium]
MRKLAVSVYKEAVLLLRDFEGILMLFLMPLILVVVITLLQDKSFQNITEKKVQIIIVDADNDSLGIAFRNGLKQSGMFEVTEIISTDSSAVVAAKKQVAEGKFQIGIFIPQNTTLQVKNRAVALIQRQIPNVVQTAGVNINSSATIDLFFDPVTKDSFKGITKSTFMQFAANTETKIIFESYSRFIDVLTNQSTPIEFPKTPVINFNEDLVSEYTGGILPNSVQHNVPAWTLFGMFLICIPVAGNIIKERYDGCLSRIQTIPVNYLVVMTGKFVVFVSICLVQALLIVLVGMYVMPLLGMPELVVGSNWFALFVISLGSAFAATSFGLLIGNLATTQIQASVFGSISAVLLAAIGGVWIPNMVMPDLMRRISEFSPMNWGIQGYYKVFLRGDGFLQIYPEFIKLTVFAIVCVLLGALFKKHLKEG